MGRQGHGEAPSREERLAAKLRENLRLRKVRARSDVSGGETGGEPDCMPALSKDPALSKYNAKS